MSDKLKRLFIPGIMDALLPTVEWVQELLGGKVDKVTGKGLSTNDYTTEEKEKLSGIAAGAEVNAVTSVNGMTGAVTIQTGGNVDSVNGKTGVVTLTASDVGALPSNTPIPSAVTEQTVAGWGFTKNTGTYNKPAGGIPDSDIASAATWNAKGTYSKPSGGIPKTDLASDVQTSLGKADTALQEHQSLSGYATEQDVSLAIRAADPPLEPILTLTADGTTKYDILQDENGNALSLKKAVVRFTMGVDASAAGDFSIEMYSSTKVIGNFYRSWAASAKASWSSIGIIRQDSGYWTQEQSPLANNGYSQLCARAPFMYANAVADYPAITRFKFTATPPAGMIIELFGVPYDSNGIQPAESNSFGGGA